MYFFFLCIFEWVCLFVHLTDISATRMVSYSEVVNHKTLESTNFCCNSLTKPWMTRGSYSILQDIKILHKSLGMNKSHQIYHRLSQKKGPVILPYSLWWRGAISHFPNSPIQRCFLDLDRKFSLSIQVRPPIKPIIKLDIFSFFVGL